MVLRSDLEQPTFWASVFTLQEGRFLGTSSSAGGGLCDISLWEAAAPSDSCCSHLGPLGPRPPQAPCRCSGWAPTAFPCTRMGPTQSDPAQASVPEMPRFTAGSRSLHSVLPSPGHDLPLSFARLAPCLPGFRAISPQRGLS